MGILQNLKAIKENLKRIGELSEKVEALDVEVGSISNTVGKLSHYHRGVDFESRGSRAHEDRMALLRRENPGDPTRKKRSL